MQDQTQAESKSSQNNPASAHKPAQGQAEIQGSQDYYEEVAEYRIGEGPPPLPLIVMFALIVLWAMLSWIPFFGY